VVADRPAKANPKRVRITVGGDKLDYRFDVSTRTADLITAQLLFNSTISTDCAKFCTMDIKNFYLNTPMERHEFMRIPLDIISDDIKEQYDILSKADGNSVVIEIMKGM